jgi:hypothetical protein
MVLLTGCASGPDPALSPGAMSAPSAQVQPGDRVEGTVVDQPTGQPLRAVVVSIGGVHTLTDTLGRFTLNAPETGTELLTTRLVGYREEQSELFRTSDNVVLAIIALVRDRFSFSTDPSVAPLTIQGLVRDGPEGGPVAQVQAFGSNSALGALTQRDGSFRLVVPKPGTYTLRFERVGLVQVEGLIELGANVGVRVEAVMDQRWPDCEVIITGPPTTGLRTFVRDLETGRAPKTRVTLTISGSGIRDGVSAADSSAAALELWAGRAVRGSGPYEVTLAAQGYAPWRNTIVLERAECRGDFFRSLNVWLVPHAR